MIYIITAGNCGHCVRFKDDFVSTGILEREMARAGKSYVHIQLKEMRDIKTIANIPDKVRSMVSWFPFICATNAHGDVVSVFNGTISNGTAQMIRPPIPPKPENIISHFASIPNAPEPSMNKRTDTITTAFSVRKA